MNKVSNKVSSVALGAICLLTFDQSFSAIILKTCRNDVKHM